MIGWAPREVITNTDKKNFAGARYQTSLELHFLLWDKLREKLISYRDRTNTLRTKNKVTRKLFWKTTRLTCTDLCIPDWSYARCHVLKFLSTGKCLNTLPLRPREFLSDNQEVARTKKFVFCRFCLFLACHKIFSSQKVDLLLAEALKEQFFPS